VLHGVPERGRGVERREDRAARGLDVALEPFDLLLRADVRLAGVSQDARRLVARPLGLGGRLPARLERDSRGSRRASRS